MSLLSDSISALNQYFQFNSILQYHLEQACEVIDIPSGPRSILFLLSVNPLLTVPDMAKMRHVTRQHIQVQVNVLYEKGLVLAMENPTHARSFQYKLTQDGHILVQELQALISHYFKENFELDSISDLVLLQDKLLSQ